MHPAGGKSMWILKGLIFGFFMFLIMAIATPIAEGAQLQTEKLIVKLILWLLMGLAYGYTVNLIERKKD